MPCITVYLLLFYFIKIFILEEDALFTSKCLCHETESYTILIMYSFVYSTFNYRWMVECVHYIQFVYRKLEDKTGYAHF